MTLRTTPGTTEDQAAESAENQASPAGPLSEDELRRMDMWWRAANYLSVGQIYLMDNPLLREQLEAEHVKPRLLGHWGTTPGLNFLYAHLNRAISQRDLNMIYIIGPGHGGPSLVSAAWLEGTYSEVYPNITRDGPGMKRLFTQFSFPGGIPSHVAPETPGSIHEGGELGYAISHAYGAAFDNPDLVVACIVGDGEAETGPLATSWHSNKFLNPANPTILARIPTDELLDLMRGYGHEPYVVEGDDPTTMHKQFATTLDTCLDRIAEIQRDYREGGASGRPTWPMIIFRSPKGWTGPKEIDGKRVEGYWRSHQVPFSDPRQNPSHRKELQKWMMSYKPEELFDSEGRPVPEIADLHPVGERRMSANPHANGGELRHPLRMPDFRDYEVKIDMAGHTIAEATRVMGTFLRDVMKLNEDHRNFRLFSPDENNSNRWQDVLEATDRAWQAEIYDYDDHLATDGRVMEILSEHTIQGWLEGYLLTGRHGFLSTYEAFIHLVDSMFNQHAKWLKVTDDIEWRRPISSLNYLLSSHVWRQDHNGFSHQDPGFIDHVMNKKAEIVRVYLPPDANTLLSTTDHCLRSSQYVNVIVAGKQPAPQYLSMEDAIKHCTKGIGIWDWASSDQDGRTDLVMAAAGDVPTMEALAATEILQKRFPDLRIRFINVVDMMRLQDDRQHPHGLSDREFVALFTPTAPIVFAYHGYPWLIHRLTYRRSNHENIHVRGYKEEGTTTTPFDMCVLNEIDRFSLAIDAIDRVPQLGSSAAHVRQELVDKIIEHRQYIRRYGEDMPEIAGWMWHASAEEERSLTATEPGVTATAGDNV